MWRTPGYSAIDQGRNRMAYDALYRRNFQELFWIDADTAFKPEDVGKIRDRNLPICAAAYPFKGWPRMTVKPFLNQKILFDTHFGGLVEVACVATGFLYTKAIVYETMKQQLNLPECNTAFDAPQIPFFKPDVWYENGEPYYYGEDFSFCKRANQCGFRIVLDTTIKLGHIGNYQYDWEDMINKVGEVTKKAPLPFEYADTIGGTHHKK